jgi:hypothetical protein
MALRMAPTAPFAAPFSQSIRIFSEKTSESYKDVSQ